MQKHYLFSRTILKSDQKLKIVYNLGIYSSDIKSINLFIMFSLNSEMNEMLTLSHLMNMCVQM